MLHVSEFVPKAQVVCVIQYWLSILHLSLYMTCGGNGNYCNCGIGVDPVTSHLVLIVLIKSLWHDPRLADRCDQWNYK